MNEIHSVISHYMRANKPWERPLEPLLCRQITDISTTTTTDTTIKDPVIIVEIKIMVCRFDTSLVVLTSIVGSGVGVRLSPGRSDGSTAVVSGRVV